MYSTNNSAVPVVPTALLSSPTSAAHFSKGFVCKTLSIFPISSAGNVFLKLRVLGLILMAYIVEFWKVYVVCSFRLFTRMHVSSWKAKRFSVWIEGGFMPLEQKPSCWSVSRNSKSKPALPKNKKGDDTWKLRARKRAAVAGEWAEIHGEKSVNLVCLCGCL